MLVRAHQQRLQARLEASCLARRGHHDAHAGQARATRTQLDSIARSRSRSSHQSRWRQIRFDRPPACFPGAACHTRLRGCARGTPPLAIKDSRNVADSFRAEACAQPTRGRDCWQRPAAGRQPSPRGSCETHRGCRRALRESISTGFQPGLKQGSDRRPASSIRPRRRIPRVFEESLATR
jgi:hypothetical protein